MYLMFLIITVYHHPFVKQKVDDFMNNKFFLPEHLNNQYIASELETISIFEAKKQADIKQMEKKIKIKQGIIQKYKAVKKAMVILQVSLTYFNNLFEKMKNLITWKDPQKTWFFLSCLLCLYTVASSITFRFFFLITCKEIKFSFFIFS